MSAFGWSLPAGCTTLPGEEDGAYELKIDGVWWAWDESDNIYESVPGSTERDDGYVYRGKLEWDDSIGDTDAQLIAFVKKHNKSLNNAWVAVCRRTEDPKLRCFENYLSGLGIESRRNGYSFHAPILEVREHQLDAAWAALGHDVFGDGRVFDDIPDDDPAAQLRAFVSNHKRSV